MKLLIGYDGSSGAEDALNDLPKAGLPPGGEILILSIADVWMPPAAGPIDPSLPNWLTTPGDRTRQRVAQAVEQARSVAESAAHQVRSKLAGWEVMADACADSPAWALIQKAEQWAADLIVLGSRGHSSLEKCLLGGVAYQVLANGTRSVRIVRPNSRTEGEPLRLLVGVDGSSDSQATVEAVRARDWPEDSQVRLITVVDQSMQAVLDMPGASPTARTMASHSEETDRLRNLLDERADSLRPSAKSVSCLLREGDPKRVLVEEARQWNADCIFVGAKGLSRVERFLLGSVSAAVAARAHCSVEVVRPQKTNRRDA